MFKSPAQTVRQRTEVRRLAGPYVEGASDEALARLLRKFSSVSPRNTIDLAVTALSMPKRPAWVEEIVGPIPLKPRKAEPTQNTP